MASQLCKAEEAGRAYSRCVLGLKDAEMSQALGQDQQVCIFEILTEKYIKFLDARAPPHKVFKHLRLKTITKANIERNKGGTRVVQTLEQSNTFNRHIQVSKLFQPKQGTEQGLAYEETLYLQPDKLVKGRSE